MADIFISYAKATKEAVSVLAKALEAEGYDIWWDSELPPHKSYSDVIAEEIGKAKAVVVAWSEAAAGSQWVRAEADMARNSRKLVQTTIEAGFIPPIPFNQIQVADLSTWRGDGGNAEWAKVRAAVSELVRAAPAGKAPKLKKRSKPLQRPRLTIMGVLGRLRYLLIWGAVLAAAVGFLAFMFGPRSTPLPASTETMVEEAPAAPVFASAVAEATAAKIAHGLSTKRDVCNGAKLSDVRVVTIASCRTDDAFRYAVVRNSSYSSSDRQLADPRVEGRIAVHDFAGASSSFSKQPLARTTPTPEEDVYVGVLTGVENAFFPSPPCHILAAAVATPEAPTPLRRTDCVVPGSLPGAALFNTGGALVGLIDTDGSVVPIEEIRAALFKLGVRVDDKS